MSGRLGGTSAKVGDVEKGRIEQTRVKRYWPGKAPDWAPGDDSDDEPAIPVEEEARTAVAPPVIVAKGDDPRLRRLQASRAERDEDEDGEGRREVVRAQVLARRRAREEEEEEEEEEEGEGEEERDEEEPAPAERRVRQRMADSDDDDEDDEDRARRREMAKLRYLQRQKEEEAAAAVEEEDDEEDEESDEDGSEYETDSEEEEGGGRAMIKPVFVPKKERETIAERERIEEEERLAEEKEAARKQSRKIESRQLVIEQIKREEEEAAALNEVSHDIKDVDTDDEKDEQEEYELWKAREFARIKRDRDERDAIDKEREEMERVRRMTDEERAEWERLNPKDSQGKEKSKQKFMQKYYHAGAFFQEASDDKFGTQGVEEIYKRDYSAPTGEDKMDRSILPAVMQVKNFGRSGRSKWTHLVNEDTTNFETPWMQNDELRKKYDSKMAGTGDLSKPKAKW